MNIGTIGIFASRPGTPNRARSRSRPASQDGFKLHGFTAIEPASTLSKPNLDEVSKNLHDAMRERGRKRKDEDGWVIERDGAVTPSSDFEPQEAKKDI